MSTELHKPPFWIESTFQGKLRKAGCVFYAQHEEHPVIRTKLVLYREVKEWLSIYSHRLDCVGIELAAFQECVRRGCKFVVTYAKKERVLNVAPVASFTFARDMNGGTQARALLNTTLTFKEAAKLKRPKPVSLIIRALPAQPFASRPKPVSKRQTQLFA